MSIKNLFIVCFLFIAISLARPITAFAATTPSLGAAETYGILANTYTNSAVGTTVNGDVGFLVAPTVPPAGVHTNYGSASPYATAGADQGTALTDLNSQACTFTWGAAVELSADPLHGTIGVYTPGVYCGNAAMAVSGPITLNGSGTYIFRSVGAFDTTAGIVITLAGGASACDIFWTSLGAATIGAGTSFQGTLIDNAAVTVGAGTTWTGRILAFNGPVTTATTTITVPSCVAPPPAQAILHIIKQVINDDGGTAVVADAMVHVTASGTDVTGSPQAGEAAPGTAYTLDAGDYTVSEDVLADYDVTFSGSCDANGDITLSSGDDETCTIINDDIAPAPVVIPPATITVVKTVINDNGRTLSIADFPLFVGATLVTSGVTNTFAPATYVVTETTQASYTSTFSDDCDASGNIILVPGDNLSCLITNDDIAAASGGGNGSGRSIVLPVAANPEAISLPTDSLPFPVFAIAAKIIDPAVPMPIIPVPPALPRTGLGLPQNASVWSIVAVGMLAAALLLFVIHKKQTL